MITKTLEKNKAVNLRGSGLSYSEILKQVKVSKSTLSLWLREVGLSKKQVQRISEKKRLSALRGAKSRKDSRIFLVNQIHEKAIKEIGKISKRELWLMGVCLYWAEGAKEKDYKPGSGVKFSNSDPLMIKFYIKWLLEICNVSREEISFSILIHKTYSERFNQVKEFWSMSTSFSLDHFNKIYLKNHNTKTTNRKNIGNVYNGSLIVYVRNSSGLNRKIAGWTKGIVKNNKHCGIV